MSLLSPLINPIRVVCSLSPDGATISFAEVAINKCDMRSINRT